MTLGAAAPERDRREGRRPTGSGGSRTRSPRLRSTTPARHRRRRPAVGTVVDPPADRAEQSELLRAGLRGDLTARADRAGAQGEQQDRRAESAPSRRGRNAKSAAAAPTASPTTSSVVCNDVSLRRCSSGISENALGSASGVTSVPSGSTTTPPARRAPVTERTARGNRPAALGRARVRTRGRAAAPARSDRAPRATRPHERRRHPPRARTTRQPLRKRRRRRAPARLVSPCLSALQSRTSSAQSGKIPASRPTSTAWYPTKRAARPSP